MIIKKDL